MTDPESAILTAALGTLQPGTVASTTLAAVVARLLGVAADRVRLVSGESGRPRVMVDGVALNALVAQAEQTAMGVGAEMVARMRGEAA